MVAVIKPVIQVRGMRVEDLDTVSALENLSYEFPWSVGVFSDCLKAGHPCWVLCVDEAVAGYGILSTGAGEAQAHALGRALPSMVMHRAQIVLADEPALVLGSAAAKRRLWNALRRVRRALAAADG